jgi:hypothetical protein
LTMSFSPGFRLMVSGILLLLRRLVGLGIVGGEG